MGGHQVLQCCLPELVSEDAARRQRFTLSPEAPSCPLALLEWGALIIN